MGLHVIAGCTVGNRYLLTGQLSEHSGDDVFAARDNETGAEVVVKFQPPKDVDSTAWFTTKGRLLEQEVRLGMRLRKIEGLARTIDGGEFGGRKYLVVEKISGMTLEDYRRDNIPVKSPFASAVIYQLATTLHAIHTRGFVHRDVKTENALIQWDGRVRLIDLGLAAPINPSPRRRTGPSGTTGYRAPEQYDPWGEITPRADIYALGCILFEMSAMWLPYQHYDSKPPREIEPIPERDRLDQMPEPLRALGLSMIAYDPADRPQSMAQVCEALRPLIPPVGAEAPPYAGSIDPTAPLRKPPPPRPRNARTRAPRTHASL